MLIPYVITCKELIIYTAPFMIKIFIFLAVVWQIIYFYVAYFLMYYVVLSPLMYLDNPLNVQKSTFSTSKRNVLIESHVREYGWLNLQVNI